MTLSLLLVTPRKRLRIWHSFTPFTCLVVRDGSRIRFWLDSWVLHILAFSLNCLTFLLIVMDLCLILFCPPPLWQIKNSILDETKDSEIHDLVELVNVSKVFHFLLSLPATESGL